jgi:farnesyl diphosphate synthase
MTQKQCTDSLAGLLAPLAGRAEADLARWLVEPGVPETLAEAMRYCTLGGGKRLRPALAYLAADAVGADADDEMLRRGAVAVEIIHCYSLVHDDLPSMDDDTLRRGRPTAHVQFGEAMAILAGDALLTRAFGVLAEADSPLGGRLVSELALASGASGMIAGQVADMDLCKLAPGLDGLTYIHARKTGAIIRGAARMGAIAGGADQADLEAITEYSIALGQAFQLVDDLLDVTGDAPTLGKTPGKDATSDKRTYVALLGLEQAARLGEKLTAQATKALEPLGERGAKLRLLAELLGTRTH